MVAEDKEKGGKGIIERSKDAEQVDSKDYKLEFFGARHSLALLGFLGLCCDYALRVNLSVAIVAMVNSTDTSNENVSQSCSIPNDTSTTNDDENTGDFEWDEGTQGLILGSFFWGYFISNIPSGIAAEKFGGKIVLGTGIVATGFLTIISPWAAGVSSSLFIFVRFLEGLTEGVYYPAMNSLIAKWYPKKERSKFSSFIFSGMQLGTVISLMASGYLCSSDFLGGWPSAFYVFGVLTLVWGVFWFWLVYNNPEEHPRISDEELRYVTDGCRRVKDENNKFATPWKSILTSVPFWAIAVAHFGQNWGFYTLLTELPTYFDRILHINMKNNGVFTALPYFGGWVFTNVFGLLTDRMIRNGTLTIIQVRRVAMALALYGPMICLIVMCFINCHTAWAISILIISGTVNGAMFCGYMCSHVDISPTYAGTLMGITNTVATIPGFISPIVTGQLTNDNQTLEAWKIVFAISVVIYLVTNAVYLIFIQTNIQPWNYPIKDNNNSNENSKKTNLEFDTKM